MNNTTTLEQSVIKEVASLFGDIDALKQMLSLARKLKREKKTKVIERTDADNSISKEEIIDDLREAFIELKKVERGQAVARPVEALINELSTSASSVWQRSISQ